MNLQKIEHLIEKYEKGATSLSEERILKNFFTKDDVPVHLRSYSYLFRHIDDSRDEELPDKNFDDRILNIIEQDVIPISTNSSTRKRRIYTLISIAASIIILFGVYFQFNDHIVNTKDTYDDPKLAYAETKKVLLMISGNLNSGVSELKNVSEFNSGLEKLNKFSEFNTGVKSLEKISILDKSKKIVTIKN